MSIRKTHFEQIPVTVVKKIITESPDSIQPVMEADQELRTEDTPRRESWRDVAQRAQRESDPKKMIGLVEELIASLDEEQSRRVPKVVGDSKL